MSYHPGHTVISLARCISWTLIVAVLSACALKLPAPEPLAATPLETLCRALFDELDQTIDRYGVSDAQATRIAGYPYLRVNRLLASYRGEIMDEIRFNAWVDHLRALDREGRHYEIANLAPQIRASLPHAAGLDSETELEAAVEECAASLRQLDLSLPQHRGQLARQAKVPDDYSSSRRALGLYPLTALAVRATIKHWHKRMRRSFASHQTIAASSPELMRYVPRATGRRMSPADIARLFRERRDALGVPRLTAAEQEGLFASYAPIVEVRTQAHEDRIGAPYWNGDIHPRIDVTKPTLYTHLSYTRFRGATLPQLNYLWWFPERRKSAWWDLLGGHLDGLIWRVTLASDGTPLMYDTIHPCGCYHTFFPSARMRAKTLNGIYIEPILIAPTAPTLDVGQRAVVHVDAHTHYVLGLTAGTANDTAVSYEMKRYETLRSLAVRNGSRRSLFDERGFIPGTQRGERWLLWPMGIVNPGAMRQWGRHATAFVGRRHFDEAYLLEELFDVAGSDVHHQENGAAADISGTGTPW